MIKFIGLFFKFQLRSSLRIFFTRRPCRVIKILVTSTYKKREEPIFHVRRCKNSLFSCNIYWYGWEKMKWCDDLSPWRKSAYQFAFSLNSSIISNKKTAKSLQSIYYTHVVIQCWQSQDSRENCNRGKLPYYVLSNRSNRLYNITLMKLIVRMLSLVTSYKHNTKDFSTDGLFLMPLSPWINSANTVFWIMDFWLTQTENACISINNGWANFPFSVTSRI